MKNSDREDFRQWLSKHTSLSDKVIRDTVSRLCRVEKIMPIDINADAEDYLFKLGKKQQFKELSQSVKSQLRRAYKLYHQYASH